MAERKDPIGESRRRRRITELIAAVFSKYGYDEIRLSTVERKAKFKRCELEPILISGYGGDRALRPDLTALTAYKVIKEHLIEPNRFCRLFYIGDCYRSKMVVELEGARASQRPEIDEICQIGLEHLNTVSARADAEVMLIAIDVLQTLGIRNWRLKIGNSRVLMEILKGCAMKAKHEIMTHLDWLTRLGDDLAYNTKSRKKDELCAIIDRMRARLSSEFGETRAVDCEGKRTRELAALALEIQGQLRSAYRSRWESVYLVPDSLSALLVSLLDKKGADFRTRLGEIEDEFADCPRFEVARMLEVYGILESRLRGKKPDLLKDCELDLCLARPVKYYTGIIFDVCCETPLGLKPICGGGRYDTLIEEVSREMAQDRSAQQGREEISQIDVPGTGFAFELGGLAGMLGTPRVEEVIQSMGRLDTQCRIMINCANCWSRSDDLADELRLKYNVMVVPDTKDIEEAKDRERAHPDGHGLYVEMRPQLSRGREVGEGKLLVRYLRRNGAGVIEPAEGVEITKSNIENILRVMGYARGGNGARVELHDSGNGRSGSL